MGQACSMNLSLRQALDVLATKVQAIKDRGGVADDDPVTLEVDFHEEKGKNRLHVGITWSEGAQDRATR